MIWTVMNMRRSAKNMKLIDADELIKYIKIWEIGTSISSDQKEFIDCVNKQPAVFDVDNVVEQLENYLFEKYCIEGDTTIDEIVKGGGVE
nr:MAG TPA: hypothetical protein [Caudoviricetes sp.]